MVMDESDVSGMFTSYVHHYVQNLAPPNDVAILQDHDAVTIIRTATLADLESSKANASYRKRIGPDEDNFRDIDGSVALLVEELEVVPGVDDASHKLFMFRHSMIDRTDEWASRIGELVQLKRLRGATINLAKAVTGNFPYSQFDEIGLPIATDVNDLVSVLNKAALAHFGTIDTKMLFAETVRFI